MRNNWGKFLETFCFFFLLFILTMNCTQMLAPVCFKNNFLFAVQKETFSHRYRLTDEFGEV